MLKVRVPSFSNCAVEAQAWRQKMRLGCRGEPPPQHKPGTPEDFLITDVGELMATIGVTLKDEGKIPAEVGATCTSYIEALTGFDMN